MVLKHFNNGTADLNPVGGMDIQGLQLNVLTE